MKPRLKGRMEKARTRCRRLGRLVAAGMAQYGVAASLVLSAHSSPAITLEGTVMFDGSQTDAVGVAVHTTQGTQVKKTLIAAPGMYALSNVPPSQVSSVSLPGGDVTVPVGQAFWLVNTNAFFQTMVMGGEIPTNSSVNLPIRQGVNYLANPFPNVMMWESTALASDSPEGSQLLLWCAMHSRFTLHVKTSAGWAPKGASVPAGEGFVYVQPDASVTHWHVERPYAWPPAWEPEVDDEHPSESGIGFLAVVLAPGTRRLMSNPFRTLHHEPHTVESAVGAPPVMGADADQHWARLGWFDAEAGSMVWLERSGHAWWIIAEQRDGYVVSAWLDANGNGQWDVHEPFGLFHEVPLFLTNDQSGVDITLHATHRMLSVISEYSGQVVGDPAGAGPYPYGHSATSSVSRIHPLGPGMRLRVVTPPVTSD